jgi:hypothetical protein
VSRSGVRATLMCSVYIRNVNTTKPDSILVLGMILNDEDVGYVFHVSQREWCIFIKAARYLSVSFLMIYI